MPVHNWQMGYDELKCAGEEDSNYSDPRCAGDTYQFYKQKVGSFQIWLSRMTTSIAMHFTIELELYLISTVLIYVYEL